MITFRLLEAADFPRLGGWLAQEHVARWWNHETSPEAVERDFGPAVRGEEPSEVFVAVLDGRPLGLMQRYRLADYPEYVTELAPVVEVPPGAWSIDYLIGHRDRVGRGLGPMMIRSILAATWREHPDATAVLVPVVAANRASWLALEKAGLTRVGSGDLKPDNPVDDPLHHVYRIDRPA